MALEAIDRAKETPQGESVRAFSSGLGRSQVLFAAAICVVMVAATWLRWSGLSAQSMWPDEGFTTWLSQFSPGVQWRLLVWDNGAPMYYVALHYWVSVWGASDVSFRALSALLSTLSLPVFALIAYKVWPSRIFTLVSLALYASSFFLIWYAKEARNYALFVLLLLISVYCMLRYLAEPSMRRMFGVALTLALTLYTHNMALFYIPGFVAFWFVYPSSMNLAARIKKSALVGLIVVLLYLPWVPTLIKQMTSVHGYFWAPKPGGADLLSTLFTFNGLDIYVLQDLRRHLPISGFGPRTWALLLLAALIVCIAGAWWRVGSTDRRKSMAIQLWALLPIVVVFIWSRISTPVYVDRNLIGACAFMPLMVCAPIALQSAYKRRAFEAIAFVFLIGAVTSLSMRQQRKDDWRGVTEYLLKLPESQRLVVAFQPDCEILVHYYATGLFQSYPRPEITGLITDFHQAPPGPGLFPNFQTLDPDAFLSQAIDTRKYKEIDVALQMERLPPQVQAIPDFLRTRCSLVQEVRMNNLGVTRCVLGQK